MRSPFTLWSAPWLLGKMSFLTLSFVIWSLINFCYPWCHIQVYCVTPSGFYGISFRKSTLRRWYMFWLQRNHLVRYVYITQLENTVINETAVGLKEQCHKDFAFLGQFCTKIITLQGCYREPSSLGHPRKWFGHLNFLQQFPTHYLLGS